MSLQALIFDFDGLILDTEVAVYEAWKNNFTAHGEDLELSIYAGCVGSDFNAFDPKAHLESLVGSKIDWERWDPIREREAADRTKRLSPLPGIEALLKEAKEKDVSCVIASSSPRSWVEGHLNRLGLMDFFLTTKCIDDVSAPKPSPKLFLAAAEAVGQKPKDCVVLEDSGNGLLASIAAGIPCVVVPNQITAHMEFEGAAAKLETLEGVTLADLNTLVG